MVRIRLNGVLTELVHLPLDLMEKLSGRFKVMANLISYQTGLPEEGHAPADRDLAIALARLERAIEATAKEGESAHAFLDTATRLASRLGPPPAARPRPALIVEP